MPTWRSEVTFLTTFMPCCTQRTWTYTVACPKDSILVRLRHVQGITISGVQIIKGSGVIKSGDHGSRAPGMLGVPSGLLGSNLSLSKIIDFIFCVRVCTCAWVNVCALHAGKRSWRSEEGIRSLELELQVVVSRHVGVGNRSQELCKSGMLNNLFSPLSLNIGCFSCFCDRILTKET